MAPESQETLKTRLLVVDDDKKLCRLIKDYLEPLGYDVVTVHTGRKVWTDLLRRRLTR
jgi:CheY-like chemotaxis protein